MCDLRHMYSLDESVDEIIKYKDYILHAHIDYPKGLQRYFPNKEDGFDYKPYIQALLRSGYKGLLTIEATSYDDFASEACESAEYLSALLCNEM